jgi:hypothetical protein
MKKSDKKPGNGMILPLVLSVAIVAALAYAASVKVSPSTKGSGTSSTQTSEKASSEDAPKASGNSNAPSSDSKPAATTGSVADDSIKQIDSLLNNIVGNETESATGSATPAVTTSGTSVNGSGSAASASGSTGLQQYVNDSVGYGFSLPRNSYYAGFGPRDGATHSVGVGRGASPETFELSEVKIRFYKGKILSQVANSENGFYEDADKGMTYLALSGSTVTIEGDRTISSDIIDTVIRTAFVK